VAPRCPDSSLLGSAQVQYLSTLLGQLNGQIIQTIGGLRLANVSVVNLSSAFDGHRWCSADPWDYGLSIINPADPVSLLSQAPSIPHHAGNNRSPV